MKIMQVIPSFAFGGAEVMCENLLYAQKKLGHEVVAVSLFDLRSPIAERIESAGIKVIYMGKKPGLDLSMKKKLKRLFLKESPDAIHVHLNAIKYAAPAAKAAKMPKCIYTVHSIAEKDALGISQMLNHYFFKRSMAQPVALNMAVKESTARVYGMCECKIPVVFNGIDLSKCIVKNDYVLGENIEFLHIGSFSTPKNHDGMLRAFAKVLERHSNARLRLIGGGPLREQTEELARSLGIEKSVIFEGTQSNVYPYLHAADIFLFPSIYEGMPMTLIEAMGSALPIVATEVGGIPDMLTGGVNALLCECEVDKIADACLELIENKDLRERYGHASLDAAKAFSAENMAERYIEIYSKNKDQDHK